MRENMNDCEISIVVPLYNEEENVSELHSRLGKVLKGIGRSYEIIFVDDGSKDRTEPRPYSWTVWG